MKRLAFWVGILLMLSPLLFAKFESGDYKTIKVQSGENIDSVVTKYLKSAHFKADLLRYNNLSAQQVTTGMLLKIPYSISNERTANIKFLKGRVDKKSDESSWIKVRRIGEFLMQNDMLKTGANAKVEVRFDDGSLMQMGKNSLVSLKEYKYSKNMKSADINLKNGSLFAKVNRLRKNSTFQVSTVTSVVGVRGTQFFVEIDKNNNVKVEVYHGEVEVSGSGGSKVFVKTGFQTKVASGEVPDKPKQISTPRKIEWGR